MDNASSDDSARLVQEEFPGFNLVRFDQNRGFAAAVNAGASVTKGEKILLLNPDTELSAGALDLMEAALEDREDAKAIGFRQVDSRGFFQLSFGLKPTLTTELLRKWVQKRLDPKGTITARLIDRLYRTPRPVAWVSGAAMLVWRSEFEAISGFDEDYFLYFEDIDFCMRLIEGSGRIYYDPTGTCQRQWDTLRD